MRTYLIAATLLAPAVASAGAYVIPNGNPREIALSQATTASQEDANGVFLNAASLSGIDGVSVVAGDAILLNHTDWSDPTLGSSALQTQLNAPPSIAAAYGAKLDNGMRWAIGGGLDVPAGGSLVWPDGWPGSQYIQSVKQLVFALHATAGFSPMPGIRLGVGYTRFLAQEELHQKLNYLDHFGDGGLAMSGGANGFTLSGDFALPNLPLRIGINYSHSANLGLAGHAHFTDVPAAFQPLLHDQTVTENLTIPKVLYIGASYEVAPNVTVMAAFNYEGWNVYKSDKFIGSDGFTVEVPRNYNNAYVYRLAAEWKKPNFLPQLTLRVGGLRSQSSQPMDTLSPSLTDAGSTAFSLGGGYDINPAFRVDLGYQRAFFDSVTATGIEAFPGTYKTSVDLVSLGIRWQMDTAKK
jgi:long-subunit fatty acid transport protein